MTTEEAAGPIAWGSSGRRQAQRYQSSREHQHIFHATKPTFLSKIMSGNDADGLSPWPEHNPVALSDLMIRTWREQKAKLQRTKGPQVVGDPDASGNMPTPEEARKVITPEPLPICITPRNS